MGCDKAGLRLGSRTLLGHIRVAAQSLGLRPRIIRRDLVQRCGPLAGVYTGLKTSVAKAEMFLACDMPFISAGLLERLLDAWAADHRAGFIVSGRRAGFPFLVPVRALPIVQQQIRTKRYSLQKLAEVLKARLIRPPGRMERGLFNANTPADLKKARQLWKAGV